MSISNATWTLLVCSLLVFFSPLTAPILGQKPPIPAGDQVASRELLDWKRLPELPDQLGVAGPFVGVHEGALIVAGGANFPAPIWKTEKQWNSAVFVLQTSQSSGEWLSVGDLPDSLAYGASVSTPSGIVCIGGNNGETTSDDVFLLSWDAVRQEIDVTPYPELPKPCAYGAACLIGETIYLAGGQSGDLLDTAMKNFWSLDLSKKGSPTEFRWQQLEPWPGPPRAFNLTVRQHNGFNDAIYVISGRTQSATPELKGETASLSAPTPTVSFLTDVWEFEPERGSWRRRADVPRCVMAAAGIDVGQSHIFVLGGADGSLFGQADALRDTHPGFPKQALAYHTITDTWIVAGGMPDNQVTTTAVKWNGKIVIPSGEVRPRKRTPTVWQIDVVKRSQGFGWINYSLLFGYLLLMVGVGAYFARRNKDTNDYFRGGMTIPWWAAGCSIFATMLSSLTYTGIPSKAFAQNWVYAVGNMMIPVVAIVAVFVALPFYRRINATSAYEYLEKRFDRRTRLFGSASFTLFHIFRMAVVLSLTALALAVATPMTPVQCVLLMGLLSIIYCTLGGIEAVVWTDTIQTFVLLGGAVLALLLLIRGVDGGWQGFLQVASEADKFNFANWHWDPTQTQIALWVIIVGGIGQNISSYTADQAVVQRYMTTPSQRLAARSIWTNALLTIPATLLFFGIGSGLFAYYHSNPTKLDPTLNTDQIFPLFIAAEMPVGLAGVLVAGVFAAAQSTVSTSMNSTATSIITDFLRPLNVCASERGYLNAARLLTILAGILGTILGLLFVDPAIKSLFDAFIKVIGLFMGVLGGLFVLGGLTRRANGTGAFYGALIGATVMAALWLDGRINGYLFTAIGITSCVLSGYVLSFCVGKRPTDLQGLTIFSVKQ